MSKSNSLLSEQHSPGNDILIKEAIILAGGLGTRLRKAVPGLPKCMAPIGGKPFISYIIEYYKKQGIEKFIFALGYMHERIEDYLNDSYTTLDMVYSIEEEPLGTGGAIKLACGETTSKQVVVVNGDTLFKINLQALSFLHHQKESECTLCLKPMHTFDRYGVIEMSDNHSVKNFQEKKYFTSGNINGGVYALQVSAFLANGLPERFSFEKEYLETYYTNGQMYGLVQDEYFVDIGIPEDLEKAQSELA